MREKDTQPSFTFNKYTGKQFRFSHWRIPPPGHKLPSGRMVPQEGIYVECDENGEFIKGGECFGINPDFENL